MIRESQKEIEKAKVNYRNALSWIHKLLVAATTWLGFWPRPAGDLRSAQLATAAGKLSR